MKADPQTEAEVLAAFDRSVAAFVSRDIVAYMSCWAPDADAIDIGSGPDEICIGHAQIGAMNARAIAEAESFTFLPRWRAVSVEGSAAWLTAEGTIQGTVEGSPIAESVRYTAIFVRRDGDWLMINSHTSVPDRQQAEGRGWPTSLDAITAVVEQERVDLCNCAALDGTVTLLFTDIENSTPIAEELGDLRWIELLREHNAIVRECIALHGGTEVKTIGDAFMVAFGSARRALLCAIDIQRAISAYCAEHPEQPVRVRIGLHSGEPVREGNDFYGKSVVLASRIAGQAHGGEILVSSLLRELAESAGDIRFDDGCEVALKGLTGMHRLYAVSHA